MAMGEVFIPPKNKSSKDSGPKFMSTFTFPKAVQWAGLESFPGHFWHRSLTSDSPDLETIDLHVREDTAQLITP